MGLLCVSARNDLLTYSTLYSQTLLPRLIYSSRRSTIVFAFGIVVEFEIEFEVELEVELDSNRRSKLESNQELKLKSDMNGTWNRMRKTANIQSEFGIRSETDIRNRTQAFLPHLETKDVSGVVSMMAIIAITAK